MPDLYEVLGVAGDASADEIKAAHRRAVKKTHPDIGGDRKAFDRVQRAFNILSDAGRRARYDETGAEAELDPEALLRAQAMTTVAGKMNALLSDPDVDPRRFDLVLGIRELIDQERDGILIQVQAGREMRERLRQFGQRLKRKRNKEGADEISPMITAQIEAAGQRILVLEDALKVFAAARVMVEEYVYEVDKQTMMPVQTMISPKDHINWVFSGL